MQCYSRIQVVCEEELFLSTALGMRTGEDTLGQAEKKAFFKGHFCQH